MGSVLRSHNISSGTGLGSDAFFRDTEPWFDAAVSHTSPL